MNAMVKRLILKDWYFQRWPIAGFLAGGAVSLALLARGGTASSYAGFVLLLTVIIALGATVVIVTVVREQSQQTLPFIMSLPISPMEYTTAKVLANVLIFLVPWTALLLGMIGVLAINVPAKGGLIPFAVILMVELFASYCLMLTVAIITESEPWTVSAMVFGNLFLQAFLFGVARIPSIARGMQSAHARWGQTEALLLAGEVAVILLLLGITFFAQSRKTDFL